MSHLKYKVEICQVNCGNLGMDLQMTLKRKNNNSNDINVPKLVENEVLQPIMSKVRHSKWPLIVVLTSRKP